MEAIEVVLHSHIERSRDGAFLLVTADVQVLIVSAVRQTVYQPRVSMEAKDDVLDLW
jgi:hypothetical protein